MFSPTPLAHIIRSLPPLIIAACLLGLLAGRSLAADMPNADTVHPKPMNMNEPMAGEMKKKGMKKGDVKKAAEKHDQQMQKMLEKELAPAAGNKKQ